MEISILLVFVLGYLLIALEHPIKIDKSASALLTGVLCWTILAVHHAESKLVLEELYHHVGEIASILFFLLGAMAIVELIDSHNGFDLIIEKIKTRSKVRILFIITFLTFFFSSVLDNLTTSIVMSSLVVKILDEKSDRFWFISMVILSANAGGAFSPLGDVTTTMLWIGGQISAYNIIAKLFIPSLAVLVIPLLFISYKFKGQVFQYQQNTMESISKKESSVVPLLGLLLLLFVPVFKTLTHLPPFMGIILALSVIWILVSLLHVNKSHDEKEKLSVVTALEKIDTPSILFFLGILLAVACLDSCGILKSMADLCDQYLGNIYLTGIALGLISAIVDNVPLVAAAQGMYSLEQFPMDHNFWEFIALTTGTGGSIIIIGSAAGVAAMGIENISFIEYLKKFSWLAFLGYVSGILFFLALN